MPTVQRKYRPAGQAPMHPAHQGSQVQTQLAHSARPQSAPPGPPPSEYREHVGSAAAHQAEAAPCPPPSGWTCPRPVQSPPLRSRPGSTAHFLHEANQGANTQLEILQLELLVRRMNVVIRKPETHHDARQS